MEAGGQSHVCLTLYKPHGSCAIGATIWGGRPRPYTLHDRTFCLAPITQIHDGQLETAEERPFRRPQYDTLECSSGPKGPRPQQETPFTSSACAEKR